MSGAPRVIQVIHAITTRGQGTAADRCRVVDQYFTLDGKFLAENDCAPTAPVAMSWEKNPPPTDLPVFSCEKYFDTMDPHWCVRVPNEGKWEDYDGAPKRLWWCPLPIPPGVER